MLAVAICYDMGIFLQYLDRRNSYVLRRLDTIVPEVSAGKPGFKCGLCIPISNLIWGMRGPLCGIAGSASVLWWWLRFTGWFDRSL